MKRVTFKSLRALSGGTEFCCIRFGGAIYYTLIGTHKDQIIAARRSDCPPFFEADILYGWEHLNCQSVDNIFLIGEYDSAVIFEAIKEQLKEIEEQAEFQYR